MKLSELISDRKTFFSRVSENVIPDLEKMGIELVSFNVQNFRDEKDVINNLGIDNISQIKKDASIAKAVANKEVAIAQS
jgi:flotillin